MQRAGLVSYYDSRARPLQYSGGWTGRRRVTGLCWSAEQGLTKGLTHCTAQRKEPDEIATSTRQREAARSLSLPVAGKQNRIGKS